MIEDNFNFDSYWKLEQEEINYKRIKIFILVNVISILLYSYFDYLNVNEHWGLFFVLRVCVTLMGTLCLSLHRIKKINSTVAFFIFLSTMNLFLVFGASLLDNIEQFSSWNYSTAIAGFILPSFFITIKYRIYLSYTLAFTGIYLFFYFLNRPLAFQEMVIHGGLLILLSSLTTPLVIFMRYRNDRDKFKLKQELIILNQELEKSIDTQNKIFSIIAHDLRSPINALITMNNLVSQQIDHNDSSSAKEILGLFEKSSQKTFYLLENLLQWSSVQTSTINMKRIDLDFNEVLSEVLDLLKGNYKDKEIRIKVSADPGLRLNADKIMLETILRNLISNAVKFTNRGGEIVISGKRTDENPEFSVLDNGVGIPEDKLNKIFTLDKYSSSFGTENEKGSGLGLLICKEFVEKHNGKIWVESKKDEGTRFSFTIEKE